MKNQEVIKNSTHKNKVKGVFYMLEFLSANLATILISLVLIAIVTAIIVSMVKNKKKGKSNCGCNCAHCAMADSCHRNVK